jgi:UDP-N-acetylglucosamine:LPS N-acetylglucosamine transferase
MDLGFTDDNDFFDTLVAAARCIREFSPDLVVSHEEFAAVPAAHLNGARVVFITDWFADGSSVVMQAIRYAEQVLFIGRRGIFPEPEYMKGRVRYVGDIVRPLEYGRADRAKARDKLDIEDDCLVVSVIPGQWANEERSPLFELVLSALKEIPRSHKRLIWIAGSDYKALLRRARKYRFLTVYPYYDPIEAVMVASDVVITKANRGTTIEIDALVIPSISLSFGSNPVDDMIISHLNNNWALNVRAVDHLYLRDMICMLAAQPGPIMPAQDRSQSNTNARRTAELLLEALNVS